MRTVHLALIAVVSLSLAPVPAAAEPPSHAKAHGWRKKHDPNYVGYTGKKWEKDYGVVQGRCNTEAVGAVLGGTVGGVIGSRTDTENRPVAIILGTVIGAVIGAKIGKTIDESDRACIGHSLELAGVKKSVVWTNNATGVTYRVTPTRNFKKADQACREFVTELNAGKGKKNKDKVTGVACRRGDGEWVFNT